ncbi:MAG: flagellar hook-associated protein FlgK [Rubrivivax sp.]|nr:flagellar hook-associated protein FlgK [Rubrivivax sp.]
MGASPLMSLGIRAMAANYAALQTTSHNIANANVDGYSRQTAVMATSKGQFTGAGFFGKGVDVATVTRSHNAFLTRETANAKSLAAMDQSRLLSLQRLEQVFQPGESGMGYAAAELFNAMVDLSSRPADLATRQVVLARANDMAMRFSEAGTALDQTQATVTAELKASVSEVNQLTRAIAKANDQVAALRGAGHPANDVLDERDRLITQLSEKVLVSRIEASDGSVALFIGGGQRLVLGGEATEMRVVPSDVDPSRSALAMRDGGVNRVIDDGVFGGGSLAGLLRFQNQDLVAGRNLVGQLAAAVGMALNDQQVRGLNLQAPAGSVPSQPLFALGPQLALPQAGNLKDGSGLPIGGVTLTVTDPSALQASDYDLRESASEPGRWQLTRLSDGEISTVDSGDVVDGMRIDIDNPQPGDRFLLQPVARAANGMRALLTSPLDLAAASPLLATPAAGNTGTGEAGEMVVTASPLPYPGDTETLTFSRVGNDYEYTSSLSGITTAWRTGEPVVGANGYTLQMNGVPGDGDSFDIAPTPASALATNNGNARALLALRDGMIAGGRTVADTWSQSMADMGVRVQSAQSSSQISSAVAVQAEQTRSGQDGVNLDEEAARLIQYQQSYQAAAKVLQVAQALFDTLLQTAGR